MDIQDLILLIEKREQLKPGQKGPCICVVQGCDKDSKFSRGDNVRNTLCELHKNQLPDILKKQYTYTSQLMCNVCNISKANYKNKITGKYDRCKKCLDKESDSSNWITTKSNTCHYPNCTKEAKFGYYIVNGVKSTKKDVVTCSQHKASNHVNLSVRLCQGFNDKICTQSSGNPASARFVHKDVAEQFIKDKNDTKLTSRKKTPVPTHCLKCIQKDAVPGMYINIEKM